MLMSDVIRQKQKHMYLCTEFNNVKFNHRKKSGGGRIIFTAILWPAEFSFGGFSAAVNFSAAAAKFGCGVYIAIIHWTD